MIAVILGIFLAKLFSVVGAIFALALGYFSSGKHVLVWGSVLAASLSEVILFTAQTTRKFNLLVFVIGCIAMAIWVVVGHFGLRKLFGKAAK